MLNTANKSFKCVPPLNVHSIPLKVQSIFTFDGFRHFNLNKLSPSYDLNYPFDPDIIANMKNFSSFPDF